MRRKVVYLIAIVLGVILLSRIAYVGLSHELKERTAEEAQRVVDAIDEYERVNHRLPESLQDLIPSYLDKIPKDLSGRNTFFYSTNPVDGFILVYQINEHFGCGFSKKRAAWECGYGD